VPSGFPTNWRAPRALLPALVAASLLGAVFVAMDTSCTHSQRAATDERSVEWVCANAPGRVQMLFDSLSLDRPGLAAVKEAVGRNDYPAACKALLEYYRTAPTAKWLRMGPVEMTDKISRHAEPILADSFTAYGVRAKLQRSGDGHINWNYNGPKNDPEWGFALNDMFHLNTLREGFKNTGRRAYVERIDADVRDWVLSNPFPRRLTNAGPWRGIDTAARSRAWMHTFYGLQDYEEFSPAARILMLSSLVEHAAYLQLFHKRKAGNIAVTEMDGLAVIGAAWPEFTDAPGWRRYALEMMGPQMRDQVYPDGAQTELTSLYQRVTVEHFDRFIELFRRFGYPVPDSLVGGTESMWNYLAWTVRPDRTTPENNDADRRDVRAKLAAAAGTYQRADWAWIAGDTVAGKAPDATPSVVFPWAGHVIMRNGWDADAHWSFFDIGPYGTAHQHKDKLHLSVDAYGRALLVDAGRHTYERGPWRDYFTGSASHNVILVDGHGQKADAERATAPIAKTEYGSGDGYDFARGSFSAGFDGVRGRAVHTRVVIYVHDAFWVVADRIETDQPRTVQALWHFAPECHVRIDDRTVLTDDAGVGNLRITPAGGVYWTPAIQRGVEIPTIQGWYSGTRSDRVPAPAVTFEGQIGGTTSFAWVLTPARGDVPRVDVRTISNRAERLELRIQSSPGAWYVVTIPMNAWKPTVRREG